MKIKWQFSKVSVSYVNVLGYLFDYKIEEKEEFKATSFLYYILPCPQPQTPNRIQGYTYMKITGEK